MGVLMLFMFLQVICFKPNVSNDEPKYEIHRQWQSKLNQSNPRSSNSVWFLMTFKIETRRKGLDVLKADQVADRQGMMHKF